LEIRSNKKSGDLIKSNTNKFQLSPLRLLLVFDYQRDGLIGVDKETAPNRERRVGNSNVHACEPSSILGKH
jgi:hypothetical protein